MFTQVLRGIGTGIRELLLLAVCRRNAVGAIVTLPTQSRNLGAAIARLDPPYRACEVRITLRVQKLNN
jgi:hypothetical protein